EGQTVPGAETIANRGVLDNRDSMAQTVQQSYVEGQTGVALPAEQKKAFFSPVVFGIGGLLALFLIGIIGLGGAYMLGFFGGTKPPPPGNTPVAIAADMMAIPGGTF